MKVSKIMDGNFVTINRNRPIKDAFEEFKKDKDSLLVEDQGEIIGIITTYDLIKALNKDELENIDLEQIMTPKLLVIEQKKELKDAIEKIIKTGVDRLVVVDESGKESEVIGLLKSKDILKEWDFNQ